MKKKHAYIIYQYFPGVYGRLIPFSEDNKVDGLTIGWPVMHCPVAQVYADDLEEVYLLSQHDRDGSWLAREEVTPLVTRARSTSVGDVILPMTDDTLDWQVVGSYGFLDLDTRVIANIENIPEDDLIQRAEELSEAIRKEACAWCGGQVYGSGPYCSGICELEAEEA